MYLNNSISTCSINIGLPLEGKDFDRSSSIDRVAAMTQAKGNIIAWVCNMHSQVTERLAMQNERVGSFGKVINGIAKVFFALFLLLSLQSIVNSIINHAGLFSVNFLNMLHDDISWLFENIGFAHFVAGYRHVVCCVALITIVFVRCLGLFIVLSNINLDCTNQSSVRCSNGFVLHAVGTHGAMSYQHKVSFLS